MALRIVVINDVQTVLHLFREILGHEGHELLMFSYGVQDLTDIENFNPDLIILDYVIGNEEPGWQMLQMMKMNKGTAHIPIIICTAYLKYVQEIEGNLNLKGVSLVTKPFETEELLNAIDRAMEMRENSPALTDIKSKKKT